MKEPLISHIVPDRPWQDIALDFLEIKGRKWLIVTDYFSSYFELTEMKVTTATALINQLKPIFARFGVPERVYSDNGPPFNSEETYRNFAREWKFEIVRHSPNIHQEMGKLKTQ